MATRTPAPRKTAPTAARKVATKASPKPKATPKTTPKAAPKPTKPKAEKVKKPKMVRDSFSIPKPEYAVLDTLKQRAAKLATPVKKTELLRAGIKVLAAMSDSAFLGAIKAVPSLKTGRPAKAK